MFLDPDIGDVGDEPPTDDISVSVSRDPFDEERERAVDTLWSESSAMERVEMEGFCLSVAISGALYANVFVVEIRAIGDEICDRSMDPECFILCERFGSGAGGSERFMRLVTARARDMSALLIEFLFETGSNVR